MVLTVNMVLTQREKDGNSVILNFLKKTERTTEQDQIAPYNPGTVFNISHSQLLNRL